MDIPDTGEVVSQKVPPLITAATQRGISAPTDTASGIAKGIISEAAHQLSPIKYVIIEEIKNNKTGALQATKEPLS